MARLLVINPGSTSTKVAVFDDDKQMALETIAHRVEELAGFDELWSQFDSRKRLILSALDRLGFQPSEFDAVVGRGGLLKPVEGGVYRVNERMIADAKRGVQGRHAANLGCALAWEIARLSNAVALVVDPISVDEFEPLARYSGHPEIERRSLSHALSIHEVARRAAARLGKRLGESSLVVAHLGGGISVCPVRGGRIIDANDASSDGPFSPERTGGLPLQPFISLCFSGKFTEPEVRRLVMGRGGLIAYLGTNDAAHIEQMIAQGDERAREVYHAMAYQIAKEIGAMATVLKGRVEAIVLTGGLANSQMLVGWIAERISFIAPVMIMPGEFEMEAMAAGAWRVLCGAEAAKEYL